jgi:hypothetical protein
MRTERLDWEPGGYFYMTPHTTNGKVHMVKVKVRLTAKAGKTYPFSSERQNARYQRQRRG